MPLHKPSPAGEGGAGRVCLVGGARPMLSPAALQAQCLIARYSVDPALAAMLAVFAFGVTGQ